MERIGSLRKIVCLFPESEGINIPDRQGSSAATRRMLSGFIACKSVSVVGVFLRRSNANVLDDFSYQLLWLYLPSMNWVEAVGREPKLVKKAD